MGNLDDAMTAYEHALRSNPRSITAMNAISCILRTQEQFNKAVEYLQNILKLDGNNGDAGAIFRRLTTDRPLLLDDG
jgi:glucose repression mediator protein